MKNYLQMTDEYFKVLPHLLKLSIEKQNTRMRRAISAEERLTPTLLSLATGRIFEGLKFTALISPEALASIIPETCKFICKVLKENHLKLPKKTAEKVRIARDFENSWNLHRCGGAINGKHIRTAKPAARG